MIRLFWRMTFKDFIYNLFYKIRYWYYRKFYSKKLVNYSNVKTKNWNIVFEDNFESISWKGDDRKWDIGESWGKVHPKGLLTHMGPPVHGIRYAIFTAKYNPKEFNINGEKVVVPLEVSWLSTHNTHIQKYGRWECRMTLPKERGTWPAFWTYGRKWPPEIDIIEAYGKESGRTIVDQCINLHWGRDEYNNRTKMKRWKVRIADPNIRSYQFIELAMEWLKDGIYMYTNGVKIFQFTDKKVLDKWFNVKEGEHRTLINHNIKHSAPGKARYIDDNELVDYHSQFMVDYVRIYDPVE